MSLFEPPEALAFPKETSQRLENVFLQKPTALPLEVPLQPIIIETKPHNDLPIILIGALAIIGLVGLFLAYFTTRRT